MTNVNVPNLKLEDFDPDAPINLDIISRRPVSNVIDFDFDNSFSFANELKQESEIADIRNLFGID